MIGQSRSTSRPAYRYSAEIEGFAVPAPVAMSKSPHSMKNHSCLPMAFVSFKRCPAAECWVFLFLSAAEPAARGSAPAATPVAAPENENRSFPLMPLADFGCLITAIRWLFLSFAAIRATRAETEPVVPQAALINEPVMPAIAPLGEAMPCLTAIVEKKESLAAIDFVQIAGRKLFVTG